MNMLSNPYLVTTAHPPTLHGGMIYYPPNNSAGTEVQMTPKHQKDKRDHLHVADLQKELLSTQEKNKDLQAILDETKYRLNMNEEITESLKQDIYDSLKTRHIFEKKLLDKQSALDAANKQLSDTIIQVHNLQDRIKFWEEPPYPWEVSVPKA
jgi:chromosome segregation ATPase